MVEELSQFDEGIDELRAEMQRATEAAAAAAKAGKLARMDARAARAAAREQRVRAKVARAVRREGGGELGASERPPLVGRELDAVVQRLRAAAAAMRGEAEVEGPQVKGSLQIEETGGEAQAEAAEAAAQAAAAAELQAELQAQLTLTREQSTRAAASHAEERKQLQQQVGPDRLALEREIGWR
jgi:hypothetical protein